MWKGPRQSAELFTSFPVLSWVHDRAVFPQDDPAMCVSQRRVSGSDPRVTALKAST